MMILAAKRLSQSTTGDLGEHCKDPHRVLGRAPADNTFWVGTSDPILSQLRYGGLRTPNRKFFLDITYAILRVLVHF